MGDAGMRASILRCLAAQKGSLLPVARIAEELAQNEGLVEAYLDVLEEEGLIKYFRVMGSKSGKAKITSRGYLEAHSPDYGATEEPPAAGTPAEPRPAASEIRARLQEQLDKAEELIGQGASATLDDTKDWFLWTLTVIERGFGQNSEEVRLFKGVGPGPSLWSDDLAEAKGYGQRRLLEWRRLLKTWIREIDEFQTPGGVAEQYIAPGSQFSAYVLLKDTVKGAVRSITLVDPYTDEATLNALVSVNAGVHVRVLTVNPSKDFAHALQRFRQQWGGNIEAHRGKKELHDRFLVVDDRVFFSGASIKDLGEKGSFIGEIRAEAVKDAVKKAIEAWWEAAEPISGLLRGG